MPATRYPRSRKAANKAPVPQPTSITDFGLNCKIIEFEIGPALWTAAAST